MKLEEEVLHMAWLGKLKSGEQRRFSNWKEKEGS